MKKQLVDIKWIIICCLALFVSCNKPSSVNLTANEVAIEGNLDSYLSVVTDSCTLVVKDSIPQVRIVVKLNKQQLPNKNIEMGINSDSTFLCLLDESGNAIQPSLTLSEESQKLLLAFLTVDTNMELPLTFRGPVISQGVEDSILSYAKTLKFIANIQMSVDAKAIDSYLIGLTSAIQGILENASMRGCRMGDANISYYSGQASSYIATLTPLEKMMTESQLKKFQSEKARYYRVR